MKKRLLVLLLVVCVAVTSVFGGDWKFVFGDLDQHPEVLMGFLPSYFAGGVGYTGLSLIENDTTEFQLIAGGGYSQRKVWQNPVTGEPITANPLVYDVWRVEWQFKFLQGFGESWVPGKDLVTVTAGYEGRWEYNVDSFKVGEKRNNGGSYPILTIDNWFAQHSGNADAIYPDMSLGDYGKRMMLGTTFMAGVKLNMMDDGMTYQQGFSANLVGRYAPLALNRSLGGEADFYTVTLNMQGAYTPYQLESSKGFNLFSITLVDRLYANWTDGTKVPVYAQSAGSLGRQVRGFNNWTYNSNFIVVNNFDLRFIGPEPFFNGVCPRINMFFDIGYGCGNYFNTKLKADNLLMSTGVQFTVSVFDFIDLGYQLAYLIKGDNYVDGASSRLATTVTFFLDF